MRPAGKGRHESLYFKYPMFNFRRPPEMEGPSTRHRVVVAGAGPIGLVAAIELARRGIASVVVDSKNTLNDGSRAICISRNSFETLQQLGVAETFEQKGLGWTHGRAYYQDQMIYRMEMPHSEHERYLPMYNLQQQYIEQYLVNRTKDFPGLIDLRWCSEVVGVCQSDAETELTISTPEGEYSLKSEYLLAADGARSSIRGMLNLRLQGENLPGHYVIADIQMDHDFPTERRSFFESKANPDSTILIHRQPENIWRVDWQILEGEDQEQAVEEQVVRARIQSILDMIGHTGTWDLEWWSIYTANTLCLDDYRHRRVLFIGDSAHIVPIFGVRGLNNGITDATNAAWKLAYVLNALADQSLLDSYTPERRGATLDVFRNAGKSSRFMTPPSRGYALMRKAALQLSLTQAFAARFADPRQVQPYTYAESPITSHAARNREFSNGVSAGDVAINRRLCDDAFLLDHLGLGFTGFYFETQPRVSDEIKQLASTLQQIDPDFKLIVIRREAAAAADDDCLIDGDGAVFEGYGATDRSFYLLRPDRHVAARWLCANPDEIVLALSIALARSEP